MQRMGDANWCGGGKGNMLVDNDMSEQMIKIQLPDGSVREVPRGTTALEVATSISPRLAAAVVVARIHPLTADGAGTVAGDETSEAAMYGGAEGGERLVDLTAPLTEDVALELLKENDESAPPLPPLPAAARCSSPRRVLSYRAELRALSHREAES